MKKVLLRDLAYARSGDKGDVANVGIMAKRPEYYPIIVKALTPEAIKDLYGDLVKGEVTVYPMPNIEAVECVLRGGLGGGATRTLRFDTTAKAMCTVMLRMAVAVPDDLPVQKD